MKCPICGSENLYFLNSMILCKDYKKHTSKTIEIGEYEFPINKYLCKDCGLVFEAMSEECVRDFKEKEKTFLNE